MDERATAERLVSWFAQRGFEIEKATLVGVSCSVARTAEFRWKWFATRLHVFAFVVPVEQTVGVELVQSFTEASVEYAKTNKRGLPVGLQTGVAAITMLVSSSIDQQARSWAEQRPPRYFGAFATPVLVNSATRERSTYTGTIVETVMPFVLEHLECREARILERMTEPDRIVILRVAWEETRAAYAPTGRGGCVPSTSPCRSSPPRPEPRGHDVCRVRLGQRGHLHRREGPPDRRNGGQPVGQGLDDFAATVGAPR